MERRIINPWSWQDQFGFVQAHEVSGAGRVLLCAGQTSTDAEGRPVHPGDMRAQVSLALDNLEAVLREAGLAVADVVRLNYYTTDVDAFFGAHDIIMERLAGPAAVPSAPSSAWRASPFLTADLMSHDPLGGSRSG